jgi:6-carboxyhexanoate--CoA ligase
MISVRMRAELKGLHVSGAERIVDEGRVERVIKELLKRPKDYDKMVITLEKLEEIYLDPQGSDYIQLRL